MAPQLKKPSSASDLGISESSDTSHQEPTAKSSDANEPAPVASTRAPRIALWSKVNIHYEVTDDDDTDPDDTMSSRRNSRRDSTSKGMRRVSQHFTDLADGASRLLDRVSLPSRSRSVRNNTGFSMAPPTQNQSEKRDESPADAAPAGTTGTTGEPTGITAAEYTHSGFRAPSGTFMVNGMPVVVGPPGATAGATTGATTMLMEPGARVSNAVSGPAAMGAPATAPVPARAFASAPAHASTTAADASTSRSEDTAKNAQLTADDQQAAANRDRVERERVEAELSKLLNSLEQDCDTLRVPANDFGHTGTGTTTREDPSVTVTGPSTVTESASPTTAAAGPSKKRAPSRRIARRRFPVPVRGISLPPQKPLPVGPPPPIPAAAAAKRLQNLQNLQSSARLLTLASTGPSQGPSIAGGSGGGDNQRASLLSSHSDQEDEEYKQSTPDDLLNSVKLAVTDQWNSRYSRRYKDVHVLVTWWAQPDGNPAHGSEGAAMKVIDLFRKKYEFQVKEFILENTNGNCQVRFKEALGSWVKEYGQRDTLLVFWYGGKAKVSDGGKGPTTWYETGWAGGEINSAIVPHILGECEADILTLYDCSHAVISDLKTKPRMYEHLGAAAGEYDPKFTRNINFTRALVSLLESNDVITNGLSVPDLHRKLTNYIRMRQNVDPTAVGPVELASPVYGHLTMIGPPSKGAYFGIRLMKMKKDALEEKSSAAGSAGKKESGDGDGKEVTLTFKLRENQINRVKWKEWLLAAPAEVEKMAGMKWT